MDRYQWTGNVSGHDTKSTQGDSDTSNDMSDEDVCAIAWKGYKAGKGAGKKGPNGSGPRHRGKGADEWTSGKRDDAGKKKGGKKGSKGSEPDWYSDKDKGSKGKGKGKGKGKSETRYCYDCGEQGHIGVNSPYKWAKSIDEEDDQTSSWESELEAENAEELASLETPDEEGEWCWPENSRHYLAEDDEGGQTSGGLDHLVSRHAGGAQWTWKEVTVVVDSGAAENVKPRRMFTEMGIRANREVQDQEERASRFVDSKSCPSGPLRAGRGREKASGVSLPHHPRWE